MSSDRGWRKKSAKAARWVGEHTAETTVTVLVTAGLAWLATIVPWPAWLATIIPWQAVGAWLKGTWALQRWAVLGGLLLLGVLAIALAVGLYRRRHSSTSDQIRIYAYGEPLMWRFPMTDIYRLNQEVDQHDAFILDGPFHAIDGCFSELREWQDGEYVIARKCPYCNQKIVTTNRALPIALLNLAALKALKREHVRGITLRDRMKIKLFK